MASAYESHIVSLLDGMKSTWADDGASFFDRMTSSDDVDFSQLLDLVAVGWIRYRSHDDNNTFTFNFNTVEHIKNDSFLIALTLLEDRLIQWPGGGIDNKLKEALDSVVTQWIHTKMPYIAELSGLEMRVLPPKTELK